MLIRYILITFLGFNSGALAMSGTPSAVSQEVQTKFDAPPVWAPFNYEYAQAVFAKGVQPTEQSLIGRWGVIATAVRPNSLDLTLTGNAYIPQKEYYDKDLSLYITYQWETKPFSGETYLAYEVRAALYGEFHTQGPYQSQTNPDRATVTSSFWLYELGKKSNRQYHVLNCRQIQTNPDQLICERTWYITNAFTGQPERQGENAFYVFERID